MLVYHLYAVTQTPFRTEVFARRSRCTEQFYTHLLLHKAASTHRHAFTIFFAHRACFYTDKPFQSNFYTQTLLQDVFLHTEAFSRTRSKGSRFTLRFGGCVLDSRRRADFPNHSQPFATVRNRSQPFATVRNRPPPPPAVQMKSLLPCL